MKVSFGRLTAVAATGFALAALVACGGDPEEREERGLTPSLEEAVPMSDHEMEMTEAERRAEETEEEDARSAAEFDEAHGD